MKREECQGRSMLVRVDEGPGLGAGHLMRSLALAHAWRMRGGHVFLLGRVTNPVLEEVISRFGAYHEELGVEPFGSKDIQRTLDCLGALNGSPGKAYERPWCVLDGYGFGKDYHKAVRNEGYPVLVLDDRAHLDGYEADILLNSSPDAPQLPYNMLPVTKTLFGPRYILLRPEFASVRRHVNPAPEHARTLLVSMGGADSNNMCSKVMAALQYVYVPGLEAVVVAGPSNNHYQILQKAALKSDFSVRVLSSTNDMAELMKKADMAVSAAGGTCWELCCLGVPVLMVLTADNQEGIAKGVEKAGAGILVGRAEKVTPEMLGEAVQALAANRERRSEMALCGKRLVDGHGAARAVAVMRGDPLWLRRAEMEDSARLFTWRNKPEVRAVSFRVEPIPMEEHESWFNDSLEKDVCFFYIAQDMEDELAGQIRFDVLNGMATVSVSLDSRFRGAGLGTWLIREGTLQFMRESGVRRVTAMIRENNKASEKAFLRAGYRFVGADIVRGKPSLVMENHQP